MKISNLQQFETFLRARIPSREALFMGDIGLRRAKHFMKLLGDPQNKIKVIHIAGTSGKGSTSYLTSHILQSQGFKVGLSISPHVFDIRERMQINNQLPPEKTILKYFHQILPIIKKMEQTKYGSPTFFEINVGLAYYIFYKEKVDYAVMETGLGGTLDGTNTVTSKNKICLLTKMGLDHTEILGKTLAEITQQKAGIIQRNNIVISTQQITSSNKVIQEKCREKDAKLFLVSKKNYSVTSSTPQETIFNFAFKCHPELVSGSKGDVALPIEIPKQVRNDKIIYSDLNLGLIGLHQAENCSLALSCLGILSERDDFDVNENNLRKTLDGIQIPGRMEILKHRSKTIVLDGAHNPQKMQTFIKNLIKIYPNQKFIFVLAFKKSKEWQKMLKIILPHAEKIFLSQFSTSNMDNHWSSVDNQEISKFLYKQKFTNFEILKPHSNTLENVRMILSQDEKKKPMVITGSLHFLGSIYKKANS